MGLDGEYITNKSGYDKHGKKIYRSLIAAGVQNPTVDDVNAPFVNELLSYDRFIDFMAGSFPHMPTDDYIIWAKKLVVYILENYFSDIAQP